MPPLLSIMSYTTPIRISKPYFPLLKLATITYKNRSGLSVFWHGTTRKVFFHLTGHNESDDVRFCRPSGTHVENGADEWWVYEDTNICESLAWFIPEHPTQLLFRYIFLFRGNHGKLADDKLHTDIYDCDWSDFACEKLSLEFDVISHMGFKNKYMRAGRALSEYNRLNNALSQHEDVLAWSLRVGDVYEGLS